MMDMRAPTPSSSYWPDDVPEPVDAEKIAAWPLLSDVMARHPIPISTLLLMFKAGVLLAACDVAELFEGSGLHHGLRGVRIQPAMWMELEDTEAHQDSLRLFSQATTKIGVLPSDLNAYYQLRGIRVDPVSWEAFITPRGAEAPPPQPTAEPDVAELIEDEAFEPEPVLEEELTDAVVAAKVANPHAVEAEIFGWVSYGLYGRDIDPKMFHRLYKETPSQRRDRRTKATKLAAKRGLTRGVPGKTDEDADQRPRDGGKNLAGLLDMDFTVFNKLDLPPDPFGMTVEFGTLGDIQPLYDPAAFTQDMSGLSVGLPPLVLHLASLDPMESIDGAVPSLSPGPVEGVKADRAAARKTAGRSNARR